MGGVDGFLHGTLIFDALLAEVSTDRNRHVYIGKLPSNRPPS